MSQVNSIACVNIPYFYNVIEMVNSNKSLSIGRKSYRVGLTQESFEYQVQSAADVDNHQVVTV